MSTDDVTENPTHGYASLEEFRRAKPWMSKDQAEALWAYFCPKPITNGISQSTMRQDPVKVRLLRVVKVPTIAVLVGTSVLLLLALLFPPFYAALPEGLSNNLGYHFFLDAPRQGVLAGRIDVALLVTELVVIAMCGGACWLIARELERQGEQPARGA